MNKKQTIVFNEGQMKLANHIISSCATFLDVKGRKGKDDAETTLNLLVAIEDQLRKDYYDSILNGRINGNNGEE